MNKIIMPLNNIKLIYLFAFIVSILLSVVVMMSGTIINPDGMCYVLSAQLLASGSASLKDVMHFCPQAQWPLYSVLIYFLKQMSHFSYYASAISLNALFSLISVFAFILIVKEMGGNHRVLWLAALVVLFSHQFNSLRLSIIRDHGFWAFYLSSIFFMLKYFQQPKIIIGLFFSMSLIVAALFRVEGFIFLLVMPFLIWFNLNMTFTGRVKSFLILNFPVLLICLLVFIWQYANLDLDNLSRIKEIVEQFNHGISILIQRYQIAKAALIQYVLPHDSIPDATALTFFMFLSWYGYNVVLTLSLIGTALLLYAWKTHTITFPTQTSLVVWGYVIVNLIITLVFLAERLFVSKRYLFALILTLMLWLPFALNDLIEKRNNLKHKMFLLLSIMIIFISGITGILHLGPSKHYIRSAGDWIAAHIPQQARLYTNHLELMYYTNHFGLQLFKLFPHYAAVNVMANNQWQQYDYLAIHVKRHEKNKMIGKDLTPLQTFSNKRGDRVVIYSRVLVGSK